MFVFKRNDDQNNRTYPISHSSIPNPEQSARFFTSPIAPLPASTPLSELTTHEYTQQVEPNLKLTIKLSNSQSPKGTETGVFFISGKVVGEIAFEVSNTDELGKAVEVRIDSLVVSVEGQDLSIGHINKQNTSITIGEDAKHHVFFHTSTEELVPSASPTAILGNRTFPFSLDIPSTYTHATHKDGNGLVSKLKHLGHHDREGEAIVESLNLPPTTFQNVKGAAEGEDAFVAAYSVAVSSVVHSSGERNIKISEPIILLPLNDNPSLPPYESADGKDVSSATSETKTEGIHT